MQIAFNSPTSISNRVRSQITSTVSFALKLPASRLQKLSLQEMFVLCQQHGYEVDITVGKPASLRSDEIALVAELQPA